MSQGLPSDMLAFVAEGKGDTSTLKATRLPIPEPGPREALVRVRACGINRPDILQRRGLYPPPAGAGDVLGLELAGEVIKTGDGVRRLAPGARVCALVAHGGYAEYAVVHEECALPVPAPLDMATAAGLPETYFTVEANVFMLGRLKPGETLLVHGGASGIGVAATMLALARGSRVIAVVGSRAKQDALEGMGAMAAINRHEEDFVAKAREATAGAGVDVVLDMTGGDNGQKNLDCLAFGGRIVMIATLRGATATLNLGQLMRLRGKILGSTLRARPVEEKARIARSLRRKVWPWLENGRIVPPAPTRFALAEAAQAHALMEAGEHIGKIVLET